MPKNDVLTTRSTPARLRLVAAANMRLPVSPAVRRALGLVFLRQRLLAHLVVVVRDFASVRSLFVARVLLGFHVGFLQGWGPVWPSRQDPANLILRTPITQACQTAPRSERRQVDGGQARRD